MPFKVKLVGLSLLPLKLILNPKFTVPPGGIVPFHASLVMVTDEPL